MPNTIRLPLRLEPLPETNRILVGDCIERLESMPPEFVDLTVFSPPYDGIRDYKADWTLDYQRLGAEIFRTSVDGAVCAVVIGDGTRNFATSLVNR